MKQHILDQDNVRKLLIKLSLPATIGMVVMATYNLVDTIFIGKGVGPLGIAGLSIVFPVQLFVLAIGLMIGIGGASVISRSLGEKRIERAKFAFANVMISVFVLSTLICLLGQIFIDPLLNIFGATEAIFPFAKDYMQIILFGTILFSFAMTTNNVLRAEGKAKLAMTTMIISSLMNIILDYIFIIVLDWGIKGAAWATVSAQFISATFIIFYIQFGKNLLHFELKYFKLKIDILKEVFQIGVSTFARHITDSLLFIIINNSLKHYGAENAIAAFGIINRLLRFVFMPIFGVAQGVQPIVGFNYGAKRFGRLLQTIKWGSIYSTMFSIGGFLLLMFFPNFLVRMFTDDLELIKLSVNAIRLMVLALPIIGFQIIGTVVFQSIGKAFISLVLSIARQIIFLIPLILILPKYWDLNGIWIASPISDTISAIITIIILFWQIKIFKKLARLY
ncbi:MAG: MATE family efflux transporter [Candidatus Cloacimonetes bacterium]|nr:MATE family efflux transporter [Candidatus Cloacimonadota bacterium]